MSSNDFAPISCSGVEVTLDNSVQYSPHIVL